MGEKYFDGIYIYELVRVGEHNQTINEKSQDVLKSLEIHVVPEWTSLFQ